MKKILLSLMILMCISVVVGAQQKKAANLKYFSQQLLDEIKATPEQKNKIKALSEKYDIEINEVKNDAALSKEEKDKAVKKRISERSKAYWQLLTPEQAEYLKEKKKKLEEENKPKG